MSCAPANRVSSRRGRACSQCAAGLGYCPPPLAQAIRDAAWRLHGRSFGATVRARESTCGGSIEPMPAIAYLPGTDGSNPVPSSKESAANSVQVQASALVPALLIRSPFP